MNDIWTNIFRKEKTRSAPGLTMCGRSRFHRFIRKRELPLKLQISSSKGKVTEMNFRFANEEDCGLILSYIRQLAAYEKMSDQVVATENLLRE